MDQTNCILYKSIENNLISLFNVECPKNISLNEDDIISDDEIIDELKKWFDFWAGKNPHMYVADYETMSTSTLTTILEMKTLICDTNQISILRELKKRGLYAKYKQKYGK